MEEYTPLKNHTILYSPAKGRGVNYESSHDGTLWNVFIQRPGLVAEAGVGTDGQMSTQKCSLAHPVALLVEITSHLNLTT